MKSVVRLFLLLMLVFSSFEPVMAKSEPEVSVIGPTEAVWGESLTFDVISTSPGKKTGTYELTLIVPAGVAVDVTARDGRVKQREDGSWKVLWKIRHQKGVAEAKNVISMVLANGAGTESKQVLAVKSKKKLADAWVVVSDPDVPVPAMLEWSTSLSTFDVLKGEPFSWSMSASNGSQEVLEYSIDVEVWYTCVQTNVQFSAPQSAINTWFDGNMSRSIWTWAGFVNPGESQVWKVDLITKPYVLPGCGVVVMRDNLSDVETNFFVNVLDNPQPPHGTMVFVDNGVSDQPDTLEISLFSPNYTQFVMGPVTSSDCQFSDLPGGSTSSFPVTYTKLVYHPSLLSASSGQSGPALCHLVTTFEARYSGFPGSYSVETVVEVVFP